MLLPLLLALLCQPGEASLPSGECSVDNVVCETHSDNVVGTVHGVDLEQCEKLCSQTRDCTFLTFFGPDSFPLHDHCILFSSCTSQHECNNCTTETEVCFNTCSSNILGFLGDNVVDWKFDMESEKQCKLLCRENLACFAYTHFNNSDVTFPNNCFLLSQFEEPTRSCANCKTGYPDCDNHPTSTTTIIQTTTTTADIECSITLDGSLTIHKSYLFTNTTAPTDVTTTSSETENCRLHIVAIGGGGSDAFAGGGSGFVSHTSTSLGWGARMGWRVTVGPGGIDGKSGGTSSVEDTWIGGTRIIDAKGGKGGTGFSGGGGGADVDWWGDGGSDGSDGCCGHGSGHGSGFNLASIELNHFEVSPGAGGRRSMSSEGNYVGGGGGGVLVNGDGPQDDRTSGQGYGGGGGLGQAGHGAVLLEMETY